MKKHFVGILMLLSLGTISWGQGTKEPADVWKSRVELDIMQEILNTTLKSYTQNLQKESLNLQFANLSSFYLQGQGAVFVIPTFGLRVSSVGGSHPLALGPEFSERMSDLNRQTMELSREAAALAARAGVFAGAGTSTGSGASGAGTAATPAPPAPPEPPVPPAKVDKSQSMGKPAQPDLAQQQERMRKEFQEKIKKTVEETEANRQKFLKNFSEIKGQLIEALATYGDSLTMVKPDEYVNLVLVTDRFDNQQTRSDVISARKSWITDYKAGKLNLESFKQKVIQYTE